tara:strand:- start:125 stop:889 length:765 start_codon:yes stop_codon:yes gene_type:complete
MSKLTPEDVKSLFNQPDCVAHYASAAVNLGLWQSEEIVFQRVFELDETILEIGSGAGRIALGLWELGYRKIIGTDFSRAMVSAARQLSRKLEYAVPFRVADATKLPFEPDMFDGVIFGFNGLMQIPSRERRRAALSEMGRVVRPGGKMVITTHDRAVGGTPGFWQEEESRWRNGQHDERLLEFGDLLSDSPHGELFIHIPTRDEIEADLAATGWRRREDNMRSNIADESPEVQASSVDCRFWVAEKPVLGSPWG